MERHHVPYGNQTITFNLERRHRKTLAIEVHPDGLVHVIAPENAPFHDIEARVVKRAAWILKQQHTFQNYPPPLPPRDFVSGETYRYLGRQYRLKVIEADNERVRLWRGRIEVSTRHPAEGPRVKARVQAWFRHRAQQVFRERYEYCRQLVSHHEIDHDAGFKLLTMDKRWGSCTPAGLLLLNPALVSASKDCIDYVIVHELVHTVEHNHGPRFYRLLTAVIPDWKEMRERLNSTTEPMGF